MLVLGLILLVIAVVAAVVLVTQNNSATVDIHAFGGTWQASAFWMAVVGAAILLVAVLGLSLIKAGSARNLRIRRERRQLARENARLAEQVEHTAPARDTVPVRETVVSEPVAPRNSGAGPVARTEVAPDPAARREVVAGSPGGQTAAPDVSAAPTPPTTTPSFSAEPPGREGQHHASL